jgi:hypothetical protein
VEPSRPGGMMITEETQITNLRNWIAELRSGKYKQGVGTLRNLNDEYCCLGVGCNVLDPYQWHEGSNRYNYSYLDKSLDHWLLESLGLTNSDQDTLIAMNDTQRKNFYAIADHIESRILGRLLAVQPIKEG